MKKLFVFIFIAFSSVTFAQKSPASTLCPPGTVPHFIVTFDVFNFHKPRTDCKSKFGLCIKGGQAQTVCVPAQNWQQYKIGLSNGKVAVLGLIQEGQLELHIPVALKDQEGFKGEVMTEFTLDADALTILDSNGKTYAALKTGTYAVKVSGEHYIIVIPFE